MKRLNQLISILKYLSFISVLGLFFCAGGYAANFDIVLEWDQNTDPDLVGYRVYYKAGLSGEGNLVNYDGTGADPEGASPVNVPIADDEDPDPGRVQFSLHNLDDTQVYFIVVTAYDTQALESEPSDEVSNLRITAISLDAGHVNGGETVTITGGGFKAGAKVTFGGTDATDITVVSLGQITCTAPPHDEGLVDVVVTNSDLNSAILTNGYEYLIYTVGDVNGDGEITAQDAVDAFWLSFKTPLTTIELLRADYNKDGEITSQDAVDIFWASF